MFINIKKTAFTLLEVIIALTMLVTTLTAIYQISNQVKASMISTEDRVTSLYLAQEGLEFVRNRRDYYVSRSWNEKTWWNEFLNEIWLLNRTKSYKRLVNDKETLLYVLDDISPETGTPWSIDEICWDFWDQVSDNCEAELIEIAKQEYMNPQDKTPRKYFRRILATRDKWDMNIIHIKTLIYWEDKWEFLSFVLESSLWNIAIY